jgi:hypothetical protein
MICRSERHACPPNPQSSSEDKPAPLGAIEKTKQTKKERWGARNKRRWQRVTRDQEREMGSKKQEKMATRNQRPRKERGGAINRRRWQRVTGGHNTVTADEAAQPVGHLREKTTETPKRPTRDPCPAKILFRQAKHG